MDSLSLSSFFILNECNYNKRRNTAGRIFPLFNNLKQHNYTMMNMCGYANTYTNTYIYMYTYIYCLFVLRNTCTRADSKLAGYILVLFISMHGNENTQTQKSSAYNFTELLRN